MLDLSLDPSLRWPDALAERCAALGAAPPGARNGARAELWSVLHAALFASLRMQAGRVPAASREDLEDLASAKSLELLARTEEGTWTPAGRPAHEIAGFVARVARNGLVDLARRRGREAPAPDDDEAWSALAATTDCDATPEDVAQAGQFTVALRECVSALAPRARDTWFRRAVLERSSREIAAVADVTPAHVDVIVQRARAALRECMAKKGHASADVHAGAFAELWWSLECDERRVRA